MNKLLIPATMALFAATVVVGAEAQAGFNLALGAQKGASLVEKTGCGGGGVARSYRRSTYRSVRRTKPKVQVAKAQSEKKVARIEEKQAIAKVDPKIAAGEDAVNDTPVSTTTDSIAKAATAEPLAPAKPAELASSKDVGCKQFFPAVGMTLSVSCDLPKR